MNQPRGRRNTYEYVVGKNHAVLVRCGVFALSLADVPKPITRILIQHRSRTTIPITARIIIRITRGTAITGERTTTATEASELVLRFLEQTHQLIFPQRRNCVAAVAASLVAQWNDNGAPARNALDLTLENPEFRRID